MENKKNYILGFIGGLLGGFIATIPWILMYVYGNMILSLLAIVIALGVLKGYQLFKGKVDSKLPVIIIVISIICVTVSTLIIIPLLLINKEDQIVSIDNLKILYDYQPFVDAIIKDYIISLIFTFLGISGVVANVRKQISEGSKENIKVEFTNQQFKENKEQVKQVFLKLNATDKNSAVEKEQILSELEMINAKGIFNNLRLQGIIKKHNKKYYFSLKEEKNSVIRFIKLYIKIFICILLFAIALAFIFSLI